MINAWGIDTALFYLLSMNHYKVVTKFLEWDNYVFDQFYDVCYDYKLGTTEVIAGDFKKIIEDNFPSDLKYLLSLNEEYYLYIFSPGQPYTIPRFWNTWSNKKEEDVPKYIDQCNVKENSNIVKSSVGKISKEKYEQMFKSNPILKELIGQLNVSIR